MTEQMDTMELLKAMNETPCSCGKEHHFRLDGIYSGPGALAKLPAAAAQFHAKKAYVLADINTYRAAGERVCALLRESGVECLLHVLQEDRPKPDEFTVGSAFMHFDTSCGIIVAVGSGVINDTAKILSHISGKPFILVATAPSMDGIASDTSSMTMDRLKLSLPSRHADVIIGDTEILATAPDHMLGAGLGDMVAKYISICEWRLSGVITGEYYCPHIAELVRSSLKKCIADPDGLLRRDPKALQAVFEGLVASGVSMNYAGVSRPASGTEHYFSHIWDMRSVEFGTPEDLHGIQCGVGTLLALKGYEQLRQLTPDREKAEAYVKSFDLSAWHETLKELVGKAALPMIENEKKEQKYEFSGHEKRLENIISHWEELLQIMEEELPDRKELEQLFDRMGMPKTPAELGLDPGTTPAIFRAAKDVRAKYVLPMLAWDMGVLDELTV